LMCRHVWVDSSIPAMLLLYFFISVLKLFWICYFFPTILAILLRFAGLQIVPMHINLYGGGQCSCNAMYLRGTRFRFCPSYRLSLLRFFVGFLSF
jgi:hypothetical protein